MQKTEIYIYSYMKNDKSGFAYLIKNPDLPNLSIINNYCTNSKTFFRLNSLSIMQSFKNLINEILKNETLPKSRDLKIYSNFDIQKILESKSKDAIFKSAKLLYSKFNVENINVKDIEYTEEIKKVRKLAVTITNNPDNSKFLDSQNDKFNKHIK